ncbi:biotin/lipoate A/B protein ligase family protein [Microlunatus panaciterrae]|uniref:Lipoate-protein ligase A n=1 Tax=Microlunatus panaciterrae TaxID=400768 RepID=A0ABS2RNE6_9ACTN|nr:lipoate--protein ligase family protein [Microlunatus panaciterrae]MBM7800178.1 lipoate-protein ligase A [Microlunatus panaciterrae]
MQLLSGPLQPADPALEMAFALALLRQVDRAERDDTVRIYRAGVPTMAFGRRDTRLAGFAAAVEMARRSGFAPVVRAAGGRVVGYTGSALVVDHVGRGSRFPSGMEQRFADFGALFARVLRSLGVDARVGEVPGEYCPGAHSVNARGTVKLVGTAQRIVRDAWLFSAVLVVDGTAALRPLLTEVHRRLDLPFDAASVGSVADEVPAVTTADVQAAVLAGYADRYDLRPVEPAATTLALARGLVGDHRA